MHTSTQSNVEQHITRGYYTCRLLSIAGARCRNYIATEQFNVEATRKEEEEKKTIPKIAYSLVFFHFGFFPLGFLLLCSACVFHSWKMHGPHTLTLNNFRQSAMPRQPETEYSIMASNIKLTLLLKLLLGIPDSVWVHFGCDAVGWCAPHSRGAPYMVRINVDRRRSRARVHGVTAGVCLLAIFIRTAGCVCVWAPQRAGVRTNFPYEWTLWDVSNQLDEYKTVHW